MSSETSVAQTTESRSTFNETTVEQTTVIAILAALSLSHLLNDVMQSLLPAVYPLLNAFIVMPRGQASIAWLSLGAIAASALLTFVGRWYQRHLVFRRANPQPNRGAIASPLSPARVKASIAILLALVFSKYIYLAS